MMNWLPILLSLKLALITTIILLVIVIPLAHFLTKKKSVVHTLIETLLTLPLVLPPTVVGFYLLLFFQPHTLISQFLTTTFHVNLLFSFEGLIVASVVYSLPFMLAPIANALYHFNSSLKEASYSLGKSKFMTFIQVELPLIKPTILSAMALTFAHTIGEFGVILMIGGSIPGETEVASIALFNQVQLLNYSSAHTYSLILLGISFSILFVVNLLKNRQHSFYASN